MRILLRPLGWLYGAVAAVRNYFFDKGILPSESFAVPVISVGNLVAGGSGKSPHVLLLAGWLKEKYRVAVLSRGYGRRTSGFRKVEFTDSAHDAGDEPLQYLHYHPDIIVAVCEDRREGIHRLMKLNFPPQVILLDDAFQHRYVRAGFNILLTEYDYPFTKDHLLPEGMLRETKKGAARADYILLTKSPADSADNSASLIADIQHYSTSPVAVTYMRYRDPVSFYDNSHSISVDMETAIFLVSGIARPEPLITYLKSKTEHVGHLRFRDHHEFTMSDVERIKDEFEGFRAKHPEAILCTTRKDAMRLKQVPFHSEMEELPVFIIDIESAFLKGETEFKSAVLSYVQKAD